MRRSPTARTRRPACRFTASTASRQKPTAETLKGIDTLVYDIQDAGCRFYTYISTLGCVLEAAAENKIAVVVLDRPNPLGGVAVEGPVLDAGRESFVGYHTLPVRHGLTVGELARLFNAERKIGADLEVIPMEGWRRGDLYDARGCAGSTRRRTCARLTAALLYPGIGLLETTNVSVGRGTDRPFEWVGAPWLDGAKLAAALAKEDLPGVRFVPLPADAGEQHATRARSATACRSSWTTGRASGRCGRAMALACALRRLYPDDWKADAYDRLLCQRRDAGRAEARGDVAAAGKGMADGAGALPRAAAGVFAVSGINGKEWIDIGDQLLVKLVRKIKSITDQQIDDYVLSNIWSSVYTEHEYRCWS